MPKEIPQNRKSPAVKELLIYGEHFTTSKNTQFPHSCRDPFAILPPNTHIYFPHHPSLAKCQNKINL
jgi:hypothetical protein